MGKGDDRKRISDDIALFGKNIKEVKETSDNKPILELAKSYCIDASYFLEKKDYITAFGCINYAHGLLDAFRKRAKK